MLYLAQELQCLRSYVLGGKQINKLMNTPMSRKEFLRYIGIMLLSVMGVGNVISSILNGHHKAKPTIMDNNKRGFGGGKYGA